jgi:hypothetical protein
MDKRDFQKGCACCGGWPVILAQRCHPEAATMTLVNEDGRVDVVCAECEELVVSFRSDLMEDRDESLSGGNIH